MEPHASVGIYVVTVEGRELLATENLAPGIAVYGERLLRIRGSEYRTWDPYRSKLAASILKGIEKIPIKPGQRVLYLGSASGTTVSHVSDILGAEGIVYCIDFAPRVMRDLLRNVCAHRPNAVPILADARMPERYEAIVGEVDGIYCDLAQPEQAKILADNADLFLKLGGWIMLAIKARAIDVVKHPSEVYAHEVAVLEDRRFRIQKLVDLAPYDKDHVMVLAER